MKVMEAEHFFAPPAGGTAIDGAKAVSLCFCQITGVHICRIFRLSEKQFISVSLPSAAPV
jgi:hypothetical protein